MRTALAAVAALSLTACTANPAAHIRLMAANTPPQEDSHVARVVIEERQARTFAYNEPAVHEAQPALSITDEPEPELDSSSIGVEPELAPTPDEAPPAPEEPEPETPVEEPEPEIVEGDPVVEEPVNPHPACRRATPAAFC